tara:strand:- start:399 stop:566 length:168 start_codon:yes stop_codon:yes gene_type:complete
MSEKEELEQQIKDKEDKEDWDEQRLDREIFSNMKPSKKKANKDPDPKLPNDPIDW